MHNRRPEKTEKYPLFLGTKDGISCPAKSVPLYFDALPVNCLLSASQKAAQRSTVARPPQRPPPPTSPINRGRSEKRGGKSSPRSLSAGLLLGRLGRAPRRATTSQCPQQHQPTATTSQYPEQQQANSAHSNNKPVSTAAAKTSQYPQQQQQQQYPQQQASINNKPVHSNKQKATSTEQQASIHRNNNKPVKPQQQQASIHNSNNKPVSTATTSQYPQQQQQEASIHQGLYKYLYRPWYPQQQQKNQHPPRVLSPGSQVSVRLPPPGGARVEFPSLPFPVAPSVCISHRPQSPPLYTNYWQFSLLPFLSSLVSFLPFLLLSRLPPPFSIIPCLLLPLFITFSSPSSIFPVSPSSSPLPWHPQIKTTKCFLTKDELLPPFPRTSLLPTPHPPPSPSLSSPSPPSPIRL
ncbi:hypothetical protein C7M84_023960 [Penaeus vannamei]|uniref:Uncharacterized protein n=1 Tax=Penaeus vannamei TaxID=6689 RepID=A0A423U2D8_PENVA|nr:hypothetical protein C7M84_023960 [Penaeus vannamei]